MKMAMTDLNMTIRLVIIQLDYPSDYSCYHLYMFFEKFYNTYCGLLYLQTTLQYHKNDTMVSKRV